MQQLEGNQGITHRGPPQAAAVLQARVRQLGKGLVQLVKSDLTRLTLIGVT